MAQRVNIVLIDDIDESPAAETVRFGLDGVEYEIDLNEAHAAELRKTLEFWVSRARREPGQRASRRIAQRRQTSSDASTIRAWALANGVEISDRGRIPAEVREAYLRATQGASDK